MRTLQKDIVAFFFFLYFSDYLTRPPPRLRQACGFVLRIR